MKAVPEEGDRGAVQPGERQAQGDKGDKTCALCGKQFSSLAEFTSHLMSHPELRPHVCQFCDAGFTNAQSLRTHLHTHPQERPYICGLCGDTFAKSEDLRVHTASHSNTSIVRLAVSTATPSTPTPTLVTLSAAGQREESCAVSPVPFQAVPAAASGMSQAAGEVTAVATTSTRANSAPAGMDASQEGDRRKRSHSRTPSPYPDSHPSPSRQVKRAMLTRSPHADAPQEVQEDGGGLGGRVWGVTASSRDERPQLPGQAQLLHVPDRNKVSRTSSWGSAHSREGSPAEAALVADLPRRLGRESRGSERSGERRPTICRQEEIEIGDQDLMGEDFAEDDTVFAERTEGLGRGGAPVSGHSREGDGGVSVPSPVGSGTLTRAPVPGDTTPLPSLGGAATTPLSPAVHRPHQAAVTALHPDGNESKGAVFLQRRVRSPQAVPARHHAPSTDPGRGWEVGGDRGLEGAPSPRPHTSTEGRGLGGEEVGVCVARAASLVEVGLVTAVRLQASTGRAVGGSAGSASPLLLPPSSSSSFPALVVSSGSGHASPTLRTHSPSPLPTSTTQLMVSVSQTSVGPTLVRGVQPASLPLPVAQCSSSSPVLGRSPSPCVSQALRAGPLPTATGPPPAPSAVCPPSLPPHPPALLQPHPPGAQSAGRAGGPLLVAMDSVMQEELMDSEVQSYLAGQADSPSSPGPPLPPTLLITHADSAAILMGSRGPEDPTLLVCRDKLAQGWKDGGSDLGEGSQEGEGGTGKRRGWEDWGSLGVAMQARGEGEQQQGGTTEAGASQTLLVPPPSMGH